MRVMLVNPNVCGVAIVNLGLAYVASSVKRRHEVRLVDLTFRSGGHTEYVREEAVRFGPGAAGFSVNSFNLGAALEIAAALKRAVPGLRIVFGGVHATIMPEETLANTCVDAVCVGEGEHALAEYLDCLERGVEPAVPGIWYKDAGGTVRKNPPRRFIEELDALPRPDFDDWEIGEYLRKNVYYLPGSLHLLMSRGCVYDCSFCSNPVIRKASTGRFYRTRSPESIVAEVAACRDRYASLGFRTVCFGDELFGRDPGHLASFAALYRKEGLARRIKWMCSTRPEIVTPEWAKTAAEAGCVIVMLGVESGDERLRREIYGKDFGTETVRKAVVTLREAGIEPGFCVIIGSPYDTPATTNATFRMVREATPVRTIISVYQPLPGTALSSHVGSREWVYDRDFRRQGTSLNVIRVRPARLAVVSIRLAILRIRLWGIGRFLRSLLGLGGLSSLADVARFVLAGRSRVYALLHPSARTELEQRTVYRYLMERHARRYDGPAPG